LFSIIGGRSLSRLTLTEVWLMIFELATALERWRWRAFPECAKTPSYGPASQKPFSSLKLFLRN
jgi:hypothetical protein